MEEQALGELRPNIKKIFLLNMLKIGFAVGVIITAVAFLNYMIDIKEVYKGIQEGFSGIGIQFSPPSQTQIIMWVTIALFGMGIFLMLFNYIALGKVRYIFYSNRLALYRSFLMIQVKEDMIPYSNIVKVSFEKAFPNTGNIALELSGMEQKEIKLQFIDNAVQAVANIQRLIQNYKASYYAQYAQDQRLGNIVDQLT